MGIGRVIPRKKPALLAAAAAASNAAAASVLVTPKPKGRRPKTKKKKNQQDRDERREASLELVTINDSPRPGSPIAASGLALLSPVSVSSVASSLRPSNRRKKRRVGDTDNNNTTPRQFLCMAGDELKNDLATILDVRSENLVETMTMLLSKLNDTGVVMDESLTVESETAAAEAASVAAVSATAVLVAAEAAAVSAAAVVTAAEVSAAAAVTAAELLQPTPVVYTNFTRPAPFEMIELDEDAFKVEAKYGKLRSDAAATMGKCRAVNEFVNTILGDSFSVKYTPKQLVLGVFPPEPALLFT
jgi:hypothetical protein